MPLLVRRTTFLSHVGTVVVTPFAIVLVAVRVRWPWFLVIGACVLVCVLSGARFEWLDTKSIASFGMAVILLWLVSIPLTVWDHFRYGEWETFDDQNLASTTRKFAHACATSQTQIVYGLCSPQYQARHSAAKAANEIQETLRLLPADVQIVEPEQIGLFELQLLARVQSHLNDLAANETTTIAFELFVPMSAGADVMRDSTVLRLAMSPSADDWCVDAFDLVQVDLTSPNR